MGDDFVKTEQLVDKYLKKVEKQINDALDGFKKEGYLTKKFAESFLKKTIERVKQTFERNEWRNSPVSNGNGHTNQTPRSNTNKRKLEVTEKEERPKKQKSIEPTSSDDKMEVRTKSEVKLIAILSDENVEHSVPLNHPEPVVSNTETPNSVENQMKQSTSVARNASADSGRSIELDHLKEQCERINQIFITVPDRLLQSEQSRMEIFQKLCERFNVNIPADQIEAVTREDSALIVKFREQKFKEIIMESANGKRVWLDQIINYEKPWRIHVRPYMTRYYSKLFGAALEYKQTRFLYEVRLTDKGLVVKRRENSKGKTIFSMRELTEYVNKKIG